MVSLPEILEDQLYDMDKPGPHLDAIRTIHKYLEGEKQEVRDYVEARTGKRVGLEAGVAFFPYRIIYRNGPYAYEIRGIYDDARDRWIFTPASYRSVRVHELFHKAQEELGLLERYPHPLIEGMATAAAEEITGERQISYPQETEMTKRFIKRHGWDKVLEGKAPAMQN